MTNRSGPSVVSPRDFLGFEVGEDRKLADWPQIVAYFEMLGKGSNRVRTTEVGRTTEGRPFLVVTVSAPATLAELDRYRATQARLADPRTVGSDAEAEALIAAGKTVVLVTCSVHGTEVGAAQMSMLLGHHLATSDDEATRRILDNVILLLVPSLNPDGLVIVKRWYDGTLGTPYEGVNPPFLYHKYVGHDNNRDWFMFTQVENRLTVEHCHNAWHPQIVYDLHQTRPNGMRLIVPPFIDPIDPHVDPVLEGDIAMMGTAMAAELTGQGKAGVATNVVYDAYSPSRAYQHYHGGVRILSEAASARLATPIELKASDLTTARGADPTQRTWNHPMPWKGGRWTLRDIVEYDFAAVMACLGNAARYRDVWLRNFHRVGQRAVEEKRAPHAYLVPPAQHDPITAVEMLQVLRTAAVELQEATEEFVADGVAYPAGTCVVRLAQPYGAFASTMLGIQRYPDIRQYHGGPPKPPYDNTAHSLPLQMGVDAVEVAAPFEARTRPLVSPRPPEGGVTRRGDRGVRAFLVRPETNASIRAVSRLLAAGMRVSRTTEPMAVEGVHHPPGTYVVESPQGPDDAVSAIAREESLVFEALGSPPLAPLARLRMPRVGIYQSYVPTAEEGWTRFVFEEYRIPYATLHDRDVRQGGLGQRFDAVLLPHQPPAQIADGQSAREYPPEYAGGLGRPGAESLRDFVERGGTLVGWDGGALYAARHLDLPVRDVLDGLSESEFYAPGSMLRVLLDPSHPVAYGMPSRCAVLFSNGPAFEVGAADVVGSYPQHNPLLSGWVLGHERLHGKAALASVPVGAGRVVLMGFRVHFRAQARATYKLLFNSVFAGAASA